MRAAADPRSLCRSSRVRGGDALATKDLTIGAADQDLSAWQSTSFLPKPRRCVPSPASRSAPPWPASARRTGATCSSSARPGRRRRRRVHGEPLLRRAGAAVSRAPGGGRRASRALLVNTGNANAGTGDDGLARARSTCAALARLLGCPPEQVLPFSTGVIMETLPHERIEAALPAALADAAAGPLGRRRRGDHDDRHRARRRRRAQRRDRRQDGHRHRHQQGRRHDPARTWRRCSASSPPTPRSTPALLQRLVREAADESFNRITIDGDTSTNDSFVLIATQPRRQRAGTRLDSGDGARLRDAVVDVARQLAQAIVRDGEGATKFITVRVEGGASVAECRRVAYAIEPLAARQDGVLRQRPEPRPHPRRGRLRRHRRPRPDADRPLPRRRARRRGGGRRAELPRGGRPARHEAERDHGARRPAPRRAAATVWTCDLSTTTSRSTPTTAPDVGS